MLIVPRIKWIMLACVALALTTNSANALTAPTLTKAFGMPSIPLNDQTTLTFTLMNVDTITPLSGISFTDTLPAGLVVSSPDNGMTGSCPSGIITANPGSSTISLSGASLGPSTSCVFSVKVTGTAAGTWVNTTSTVATSQGSSGGCSHG